MFVWSKNQRSLFIFLNPVIFITSIQFYVAHVNSFFFLPVFYSFALTCTCILFRFFGCYQPLPVDLCWFFSFLSLRKYATIFYFALIMTNTNMMKVISSDGKEFEIDYDVAKQSTMLKSFFNGKCPDFFIVPLLIILFLFNNRRPRWTRFITSRESGYSETSESSLIHFKN
jgi:hypothetical protein